MATLEQQPPVGDFLLDDVPQIQTIAAGELPEPLSDFGFHRAGQGRRQQSGGLLERELLHVDPIELADLPYLLYRSGNRLTVTQREDHLRRAALHDLMHDERRQIVEQVHVVDTEDDLAGRWRCRQRLDHPLQQLNRVGGIRRSPRAECAERDRPRRRCARRPAGLVAPGRGGPQRLTRYPTLSDPLRTAQKDAGNGRGRDRCLDGVHLPGTAN